MAKGKSREWLPRTIETEKLGKSAEQLASVPAKREEYGGALLNPDDLRFPWDQQAGENDYEYSLWRLFFDLGPGRSLERLVSTTKRSMEYLHGLSKRLDWDVRATAYQDYLNLTVNTLIEKQISTNRVTATRALGEVISHKIRRLHQKVMLEETENDTVQDILGQLQTMTQVFRTLKATKGEAGEGKQRSVNIMFSPIIKAGQEEVKVEVHDAAVTFEEAEITDGE